MLPLDPHYIQKLLDTEDTEDLAYLAPRLAKEWLRMRNDLKNMQDHLLKEAHALRKDQENLNDWTAEDYEERGIANARHHSARHIAEILDDTHPEMTPPLGALGWGV